MKSSEKEPIDREDLIESYFKFMKQSDLSTQIYPLNVCIVGEICHRVAMFAENKAHFHPIENEIDDHKKAGSFAFWIARLKPITYAENTSDFKRNKYINERFALLTGASYLNKNKIAHMDKNFFDTVMYQLRYRDTSCDNLATMYYQLEQSNLRAGT